jgi:hypothetical protein
MILATVMLMGVSASNAWALELRLVHAVPGAGAARLAADGSSTGPVSFAGVSSPVKAKNDQLTIRLLDSAGNKTLARVTKKLGAGDYTVVATKSAKKVALLIFRDGGGAKGRAKLRAIHAAPELGKASLTADGKTVSKGLGFEKASPYATLDPGTYKLEAMRPSGSGGALATKPGVNLEAGTSTSAILAGSAGKPITIIVTSEGAVTPANAPKTGLGGLAGSTPWVAALLAALAAGAVGGTAFRLAARRHGG